MPDDGDHTRGAEADFNPLEAFRRPALAWSGPAPTLTVLLIVSDMLALAVALLLSYSVGSRTVGQAALDPERLALFAAMFAIWLVGARLYGLYRVDGRPAMYRTVHEWVNLGHLVVLVTAAFSVVAFASGIAEPSL